MSDGGVERRRRDDAQGKGQGEEDVAVLKQ